MPTDERLNGVISIQKGDAERSLQSIADTFRDVAESSLEAASAAEIATESFEDTEDSASGLSNALESVDSISSEAATGMTEVSGASEGAQESLEDARNEAEGLNDQLSQMPATATAAAASLETLDGMNVGGFDDQSVGINSQADMGAIERIRTTLSGVGGKSIQVDTQSDIEAIERLHESLDGLRDRSITVSTETDRQGLEELRDTVDELDDTVQLDVTPNVNEDIRDSVESQIQIDGHADTDAIERVKESISGIEDESVRIETEAEPIDRQANISLGGIPDLRGRLGDITPSISPELDSEAFESLPEFDTEIEDTEDIDRLRVSLNRLSNVSEGVSTVLSNVGDDEIVGDPDNVQELRQSLNGLDTASDNAEEGLGKLSGASREMMSSVIANADSTEELTDEIGDLQRNASVAKSQLGGLSDENRSLIASQTAAIGTSHELADELEDIGDEATQSAAQITGLTGALAGLGATEVSIGGLQTSLGTLTKLKPLILSIMSALGGAGLAGGGIGGALAGIFGGGLLKAGEMRSESLIASGQASEEMRKAEGMQKAMLGLQKIMGDLKKEAYDALEPLRQPEFAQFSLDVLNGAVELIGRLSDAIASISGPVLGWADDIGNAFWATLPAILTEVKELIMDIGPILRDIGVGAIEALPAIIDTLRQQAIKLLPPLMEAANAFMDALPGILAMGNAMAMVLLPVLEGFFTVLSILPLEWLGNTLAWVAKMADPLLQAIGGLMGLLFVASAISSVIGLLSSLGSVLTTVGSIAASVFSLSSLGMLGPIGIAIGLIAGLLTLFNAWDNALKWLAKGWNGLLDVVEGVMQGMMEAFGKAINKIISFAPDWLVGKQKKKEMKINLDNIGKLDYSDYKVDSQKASKFGKKLNSPIKSAQSAMDDMTGGDDTSGPGSMSGMSQSRSMKTPLDGSGNTKKTPTPNLPQNQPTTKKEDKSTKIENNVQISGEGGQGANQARIRRAVRRGLNQANKRQRMQNTDM